MKKFTLFTPTFNRVSCLKRLFNSLKKQTYRDFEWIIIDDGSTDNTRSQVEIFKNNSSIDIRYFYQPNKGKQQAYNLAIKKAKGYFFICIDSDDIYEKNALKVLLKYWKDINDKSKCKYAGITFLSKNYDGEIIGSKFPSDKFDSNHFDIYQKYNVYGDKGIMFRTDILKKYCFPNFKNEKFITEGVLYNRIAKKYKTRYINEALQIVEYREDGLSHKYKKLLISNPKGAALYYKEFLDHSLSLSKKIKAKINYLRYTFHTDQNILSKMKSDEISIIKNLVFIPVAFFFFLFDKRVNYDG